MKSYDITDRMGKQLIDKLEKEGVFEKVDTDLYTVTKRFFNTLNDVTETFFNNGQDEGNDLDKIKRMIMILAYMRHRDVPLSNFEIVNSAVMIASFFDAVKERRLVEWVNWIKVRAAQ